MTQHEDAHLRAPSQIAPDANPRPGLTDSPRLDAMAKAAEQWGALEWGRSVASYALAESIRTGEREVRLYHLTDALRFRFPGARVELTFDQARACARAMEAAWRGSEVAKAPRVVSVYIAAPLAKDLNAQVWAALLRREGLFIASNWHESGVAMVDPTAEIERWRLLDTNLAQIRAASVMFAIVVEGAPRSTYAEIGYALALGTPVVIAHGDRGEGRLLFDSHPLVTRIADGNATAATILRAIKAAAAAFPAVSR